MHLRRWVTRTRSPSGSSLVLLLLGSLTLSGVLAYQAQDAVRSHRAASERTLRHYASLANWELRSGLDREFEDLIEDFREAADVAGPTRRQSADALEEFAEEIWDEADDCECPEALHGFFALDQRSGRIETLEGELAPEFAQWVRDSLAREAANPAPTAAAEAAQWRAVGRGRVGRADVHIRGEVPGLPAGTSLVFVTAREPHRADAPVFGFLVDVPRHAVGFTRQVLASTVLLPPSLIGDLQIDDLLAIDLAYDRTGTVFEAGEPVTSEAQVTDTLATARGSFTLSITIRPELAERLVIGGLPRSRLPLLAGIFALTLGLSAIAVVQLRREQDIVRTRGRFIASVSHELRTPLAQIRLFAELLGNDRLREEQRSRSVRVINEEAQRLTFLVENILRFSRAEQHKDRISPERTEMAPLVREIIAGFAPLAAGRGTAFRTPVREETFASVDRGAFRDGRGHAHRGAGAVRRRPRRRRSRDVVPPPHRDCDVRELRENAVLRWEYRPGSTLYLVWQQGRSSEIEGFRPNGDPAGRFDFVRGARDLLDLRPDNILMIKMTYWFNP
jgi:signal transduction histidine kinase